MRTGRAKWRRRSRRWTVDKAAAEALLDRYDAEHRHAIAGGNIDRYAQLRREMVEAMVRPASAYTLPPIDPIAVAQDKLRNARNAMDASTLSGRGRIDEALNELRVARQAITDRVRNDRR